MTSTDLFKSKSYLGGNIGFHFDTRDNPSVAKRGITFNTALNYAGGLNDNSKNSAQWNSDLTLRWALGTFARTSISTRVGYQKSFGDFEFSEIGA